MAYSINEKLSNPVTQLREDLEEAERLVVRVTSENVERFLQLLDRIDIQLTELSANSGLDLRPEKTRQESLLSRIENNPQPVAAAAGRAGGMAKLRDRNPGADGFWWRLDALLAAQRSRAARRFTVTVGGIIFFFAALYFVVYTFFPPSPDVLVVNDATNRLPDLAMEGRWDEALALIEQSQAQLSAPDVELMIWEGVIAEQLGLAERADRVLAQARGLIEAENEDLYWVTLGNTRVMAGDLDGAKVAADAALALDPLEGQAYFLLGNIAESRGDLLGAVENYERTFEYASESNPQLAVIARVRLGTLLQSGAGFFPTDTAPETPMPTSP
ncbi:hypothetical protein GC175_08410 [bacterium]|nr:hypothetical protein [bacterium]